MIGVAVVCIVVLIAYGSVAFGGHTFATSGEVIGATGCTRFPDQTCPSVAGDPRVDPFASAWQFDPWARIVHQSFASGDLALWNPYEAMGAPGAAAMQPATFDPFMILVRIDPSPLMADLTLLLALLSAGVLTYCLARVLTVGVAGAVVAGIGYSLSGWFFLYSNNQFFRVYVFLPLLLLLVEWLLRSRGWLPIPALALAVACVLYSGMPEIAFAVLAYTAGYALLRLALGPRERTRHDALGWFAFSGVVGLLLAAPVLLPFAEYVGQSFNFKSGNLGGGVIGIPARYLVTWVAPRVYADGGELYHGSINWVGPAVAALVVVALATPRAMRKLTGWPYVVMGTFFLLKIYGPLRWVGKLPGFGQVNWTAFGTPLIALSAAVLAGIGVECIERRWVDWRWLLVASTAAALSVVVLVAGQSSDLLLGFEHWDRSMSGAALVAVVVLVLALSGWRFAVYAVAAVTLVVLLLLAPQGFYQERADAFPDSTWIGELQAATRAGHERIFSTDGLLFPDTAGAYGLQDLRVVDGIFVSRSFRYLHDFVSAGITDRFTATGLAESSPAIVDNPMFDLTGARYVLSSRPDFALDILSDGQYRRVSTHGGVTVWENRDALARAFVVHDVKTAPDRNRALRKLEARSTQLFNGSRRVALDPKRTAVVEATGKDAAHLRSVGEGCEGVGSTARITSYSAGDIRLDADAKCAGLLVLSDTWYPGWHVTVDGRDAKAYATDYAFRGVPVPAGKSVVHFSYAPSSFRHGVLLAIIGAIALGVSGAVVAVRRRRNHRGGGHGVIGRGRADADRPGPRRLGPWTNPLPARPAVFLDRDGVLNEVIGDGTQSVPPRTPDELVLVGGADRALARLRRAGFVLIVVTNQPDVARGSMSLEDASSLTTIVGRALGLDDGYLCPHDRADRCLCRKPAGGSLVRAAADWDLDLARSWMIGDRWVDVVAGRNAGVGTLLVERPYSWRPAGGADAPAGSGPDATFPSLGECVGYVLAHSTADEISGPETARRGRWPR